jgi:SAM-dependent methyltransferase
LTVPHALEYRLPLQPHQGDPIPTTTTTSPLRYFNVPKIARKIRCELGRSLSNLGEKLGHQALIYNPLIFAHFHYVAMESAPLVMKAMAHVFPDAQKYLDVGAGTGAYAAHAQKIGKDVIALEHSVTARRTARAMGVDIRRFDLLKTPAADVDGGFDLAYCFEVAEHLPPDLGDLLVAFIARHAPLVVWTAAQPPWRGGIGHINEQPRSYWIEQFEKLGMQYDDAATRRLSGIWAKHVSEAWWLAENVSVFRKPG